MFISRVASLPISIWNASQITNRFKTEVGFLLVGIFCDYLQKLTNYSSILIYLESFYVLNVPSKSSLLIKIRIFQNWGFHKIRDIFIKDRDIQRRRFLSKQYSNHIFTISDMALKKTVSIPDFRPLLRSCPLLFLPHVADVKMQTQLF